MVNVIQGTDVSALQGVVPWAALARLGHRFTYIRCQVGNQAARDARFLENARGSAATGIFPGPYFFAFPLPHLDARAQAAGFHVAAQVDGRALGSVRDELPPALDLEWPPPEQWSKWGCSAPQIVDWALDALGELEGSFATLPILYSYPYFLQALSTAPRFRELLRYPLWIAGGPQYINGHGRVPDLVREKPPRVVGWERDVVIWQYDGDSPIRGLRLPPGPNGKPGLDVDGNVFLGDEAALARFCAGATPREVPGLELALLGEGCDDASHACRQERAELAIATG